MQYLIADERISFSTDSAVILDKFERFRLREEKEDCIRLEMDSLADFKEKYEHLTAHQCELLLSMQIFAKNVVCNNKLLLHAVTVIVDNYGYILAGKPGAGKSTMALQWLEHFGSRSYILNDDRTVVGIKDMQMAGWMTPWSKVSYGDPFKAYTIKAIAFISKSKDYNACIMDSEEAKNRIMDDYPVEYRNAAGKAAESFLGIIPVIKVRSNIADLDVEKMYRMMKE